MPGTTVAELKRLARREMDEELTEVPAILANSNIPDKVLANLPDVLLYEYSRGHNILARGRDLGSSLT